MPCLEGVLDTLLMAGRDGGGELVLGEPADVGGFLRMRGGGWGLLIELAEEYEIVLMLRGGAGMEAGVVNADELGGGAGDASFFFDFTGDTLGRTFSYGVGTTGKRPCLTAGALDEEYFSVRVDDGTVSDDERGTAGEDWLAERFDLF